MNLLLGKMNVDWQQRVDFNRLRKDRVERAHKMLNKHGIGAAIVYNWDSQRYLSSAYKHVYHRHIPIHYSLLIRDKGFPYVWAWPGLDEERLEEDCPWLEGRIAGNDIIPQPWIIRMLDTAKAEKEWKQAAQHIKSIMKEHGVADLPVSIDYASPYLIHALEDEGLKVVDGNSWMLEARMVKTDDEVTLMAMAATCNEAGYGMLTRDLRPGMRENDAQAIMAKAIYEAGADYIEGWVVCSGPRTSPRSLNYTDRVIRPGEFLTIEACHVTFCGYKVCYDRSFIVGGKPTELQKATYDVAVESHHRAQQLLKPGVTSHDVARLRPIPDDWKPFKDLEDIRQYRGRWKNHWGGIGMGWWEPPVCSLNEDEIVLEKNMIIAYHMVYWVKGYEGCAIENTYRITDEGCEALTKWPYEELMVIGT